MICAEARLLIGAEPGVRSAALTAHLEECDACRGFEREMRTLDQELRRALEHAPPLQDSSRAAAPRSVRRARPAWSRWALAASLVAALGVVGGLWLIPSSPSLAHELVVHVEGEPASWTSTQAASGERLARILANAGVSFDASAGEVVYAQSCLFRGHAVPHLVMKTLHGPVTVMILRSETIGSRVRFQEDGFEGVIVPAAHGSMAVLSRGEVEADAAAQQLSRSLRWLT